MAANQQELEAFELREGEEDDNGMRADEVFRGLQEVVRGNARYQASYAALF